MRDISTLVECLKGTTPLAFGVSGALASPLVSQSACISLIEAALDRGITLFDTAPAYGAGEGERRLGAALAGRGSAFVMTKAGLSASGLARRHRDFSPQAIRASVEASCFRLRRDTIDMLWLHGPAECEVTPALIDTLGELHDIGRIRYIGIAGRSEDVLAALTHDLFEAAMLPVHGTLSQVELSWIEKLKASGRTIFAIEALGQASATDGGVSRGQVWRTLQRFAGRGTRALQDPALSPGGAFDHAFALGADVVVSTTTSHRHLAENIAHMATRGHTGCG